VRELTEATSLNEPVTENDEIGWRIVTIGEPEIPSDWEKYSFTLQKEGTVQGPLTESAEFHWLQEKGVSTQGNDGRHLSPKTPAEFIKEMDQKLFPHFAGSACPF
jgi:hypothetical protein